MSDAHTSTFAQATAAQCLKAGRMPCTLVNVRKVCGERARAMGAALTRELGDAVEFTQPQGGLFFWARYLRECELDAALAQSQADVAAGRFITETAQQHMERLDALVASGPACPVSTKRGGMTPSAKKAPVRRGVRG